MTRRATEDSILAVQIFDQKKFKKKDQGFLGVINVRVGDVIDFSGGPGQERKCNDDILPLISTLLTPTIHRDAYSGPQEVD